MDSGGAWKMKRTYEDFDEFSNAITGLSGCLLPVARPRAQWWMSQARIAEITVHHLQLGARVAFAGHARSDSLFILLPLNEPPGMFVNGQPLGERSVCVLLPGRSVVLAARPATQCIGIVVPASEPGISRVLSQRQSVFDSAHVLCEPRALVRLRAIARHAFLSSSGADSTDTVDHVRPTIIDAVCAALDSCDAPEERRFGRPQYPRIHVIARCLSLVQSSDKRPIFVADLCDAAGISERTLRNIFREYFGVGPQRLLKVRSLGEIRAALLRARSDDHTVRQVVRQFGVRDFSLFARHYRALYGESPSTTLRRPVPRHASCMSHSWLTYVSHVFAHAPQSRPEVAEA